MEIFLRTEVSCFVLPVECSLSYQPQDKMLRVNRKKEENNFIVVCLQKSLLNLFYDCCFNLLIIKIDLLILVSIFLEEET